MRVLLQRVRSASVDVDEETIGRVGEGLLLLVGVGAEDVDSHGLKLARKVANLRVFPDRDGRFAHSLLETGGGALVVSQFTLYADTRKGRRPSFSASAPPDRAAPMIDAFAQALRDLGVKTVSTGRFGAMMDVALVNWGPVTIWLDSDD